MGLDWWRLEELKALPLQAWMLLAMLFMALEGMPMPEWPQGLRYVAITLLPKDEGRKPLQQRPLTIFRCYIASGRA